MNLEIVIWSDVQGLKGQAKGLVFIHLEKEMKAIFNGSLAQGWMCPTLKQ